MTESHQFQISNAHVTPVDSEGNPLPGALPQPVDGLTVTMGKIRDVLVHTEIVETEDVDWVLSPGQVWLIPKEGKPVVTWEVKVSEEQFWRIVGVVYGDEVVREMKQDLEDFLRWEGEGGSCLS